MRCLLAIVIPLVLLLGGCGSDEPPPAAPATAAGAAPGAAPELDPVSGLKMTDPSPWPNETKHGMNSPMSISGSHGSPVG